MHARLVLFGVVVGGLWLALSVAIARRSFATVRAPVRRILQGFLVASATAPVLTMVAGRASTPPGGGLALVGFAALGFSSIYNVSFLAVRGAQGLARALGRLHPRRPFRARAGDRPDPSRRALLQRGVDAALLGTAGTLSAAGYAEALRAPRLRTVEVPIPGLPPSLDGYTIVQLTDVHVGPTIRGAYLAGLVDRTLALAPDLVAITGDLVDGFAADLAPELASLARLAAPDGVYFVTGNHEYYWDAPTWCRFLESQGITVLRNEHRVVRRGGAQLVVAGVCDRHAARFVPQDRPDPKRALEGAPPGAPVIMLAHQPRSAPACVGAGARLVLSGHTHGGQYFPMNLLVHLVQPYVAGLFRVGSGWVYVSRGSGYWGPPNRLGSPSEITRVVLRSA